MDVCKRVIYTGRVQGVGFRYTAQRLASGQPIAGTVRNCSDGSVELTVQGKVTDVQVFLMAVSRQMGDLIADEKISDAETKPITGFHIVF
jgi:acylphosphatase